MKSIQNVKNREKNKDRKNFYVQNRSVGGMKDEKTNQGIYPN